MSAADASAVSVHFAIDEPPAPRSMRPPGVAAGAASRWAGGALRRLRGVALVRRARCCAGSAASPRSRAPRRRRASAPRVEPGLEDRRPADASSIRALAFRPCTSLAASARRACTVVRRSSHSSTSQPVASAMACAMSRAFRAESPSPPFMSSGKPTTKRPISSSRTRSHQARRRARRAVAAVEDAARVRHASPSSSSMATPTRTPPRSSAHVLPRTVREATWTDYHPRGAARIRVAAPSVARTRTVATPRARRGFP